MKKLLWILIVSTCLKSNAQQPFSGSFLMTFSGTGEPSLQWNIESVEDGGKMAFEIMDEMQRKGVRKRVIFNPPDSTWTMLLEMNSIKQGTRIRRSELYKNKTGAKTQLKTASEMKIINGFECQKVTLDSKDHASTLWITSSLHFNTAFIYKLLSHCGMVGTEVRKGNWYLYDNKKGMILEATTLNKVTGETYTVHITNIRKGEKQPLLFTTKGFRIANIPEGQNCGVPMDE